MLILALSPDLAEAEAAAATQEVEGVEVEDGEEAEIETGVAEALGIATAGLSLL